MVKNINIVVLGESSVGKSALVDKFSDPNTQVAPYNPDGYWGYQEDTTSASKEVSYKGNTYKLNITEVPGSKGRMSNHWQVTRAAADADVMLFCFNSQNSWSLNSIDYTYKLANEGRAPVSAKRRASLKVFRKQKQSQQPQQAQQGQQGPLPLVLCQTFSEMEGEVADAPSVASRFNARLTKASALNNTNVLETFEACIEAYLDTHRKETATPAPAPAAAADTTTTTAAQNKEKEGFVAVWTKLMAKFVKSEVTPATTSPAASDAKTTEGPTENVAQDIAPVA